MSADHLPDDAETTDDLTGLMTYVHSAALVLLLLVAVAMLALLNATKRDVAALQEQAGKSAQLAAALDQEVAAVKERVAKVVVKPAAKAESDAAADSNAQVVALAAPLPLVVERRPAPLLAGYRSAPRPAEDKGPVPTCVFRSGDPLGLADCIKRGTADKTRS